DPQTATTDVLSYRDMVETGQMLGPRIYATGPGVFSSDNIQSIDDARDVLTRYSKYWETHTIKQYMGGNRQQRQWVAMAAKEQQLMPTHEGGLALKLNLTQIRDGDPGSLGDVGHRVRRAAQPRGPEDRDDQRRAGDRHGEGSWVAREREARGPRRPRQEPAREHPEHEHGALRDEERRSVRGGHAGSDLAAAEEAAAAVLVGPRPEAAPERPEAP